MNLLNNNMNFGCLTRGPLCGPMGMPRPMGMGLGMGLGMGMIGGSLLHRPMMDMFNPMRPSIGSIAAMGIGTLASVAMAAAPMALFAAGSSFLMSGFSNPYQTFLAMELMKNTNAMQQLQAQMMAAQQTQQPQPAQQEQPVAQAENVQQPQEVAKTENAEQSKATNPIKEQEEEMSPLDKAQVKYAKAMDKQEAVQNQLARREAATNTAEANLNKAKAKLADLEAKYEAATQPELKTQLTSKIMNARQAVALKESAYEKARAAAEASRATLSEMDIRVAQAQSRFENLQAEEIVAE